MGQTVRAMMMGSAMLMPASLLHAQAPASAPGRESGADRGAASLPGVEKPTPAGLPSNFQEMDLAEFDRVEPLPVELRDVDVAEQLGQTIPLDLSFVDSRGRPVTLADYFDGTTPVVLNLTYFRCPMSCPVILSNLASTLGGMALTPGVDYRVLTVSIDPTDDWQLAHDKKHRTLGTLGATGGGGAGGKNTAPRSLDADDASVRAGATSGGFGGAGGGGGGF